ncbi:MAG TPA: T9SS type A sorting domain-containing protein [Cyclobacteriaceae bacterium]|nr:T9SS type A sorting domain-containing protein [Cyclobacteriaceae bacterium]
MKNAIVRLGFCLLFFFAAHAAFAAPPTITSITPVDGTRLNTGTVIFNVTFDQSVTGFGTTGATLLLSDVAAAGANFVVGGSGTNWTVTVSSITVNGQLTLTIPAGAAKNSGNEDSVAKVTNITFDNVAPNLTLTKKAGQADPAGQNHIEYTLKITGDNLNPSTVQTSDFDFTGSTNGGAMAVFDIQTVTPGVEYTVRVDVTGATSAGSVVLNLPAGSVTDVAGNPNASLLTASVNWMIPPSVATVTVDNIDFNTARFNSNVTNDGGGTVNTRGFIYNTTGSIGFNDATKTTDGSGTGSYNHTQGSLTPGTQYFVKAWAENDNDHTLSTPETSFYTLSNEPASNPGGFTVTGTGNSSVAITFPGFGTITNATGYLIVRRAGADVPSSLIVDGVDINSLNYAASSSVKVTEITSSGQTTFNDNTAGAGITWHYVVIAFGRNGAIGATTNYKTPFTNKNATTFSAESDIVYVNNTGTDNIDYASFQSPTLANDGSNSVRLAQFSLRDSGSGDDGDNQQTELTTLKIQITNPQFVRTIAVFDNNAAHDPKTVDPLVDTYTFTIPAGILQANDHDTDEFDIRASFKQSPITDGAIIKVTIIEATALGTKSGLAAPNAGGASTDDDTNLPTNVIEVTANHLNFTSVDAGPIAPGAEFAVSIEALDGNDNRDTDITNTVTISATSGGTLQVNGPDALTKSFTAGVINWTKLKFQFAGSDKILKVHYNGSGISTDPTTPGPIVESPGVIVTFPIGVGGFPVTVCFGDALQTPAGSFTTLPNIVITEQDPSDFSAGVARTFSLKLPTGFIFNKSLVPVPTATSGTAITAIQPVSYPADDLVRLTFTVSNITGANDAITISGLAIKYSGNTVVGPLPILRFGGTAQVKGDDEPNAQSHGTLISANGATDVSIRNTNGGSVQPNETSFDAATAPPIVLEGYTTGSPVGSGALPGVFTGDGVLKGADGKYKFYPQQVSIGAHPITFEYTSTSAPFCKSVKTVTFNVVAGFINGLHSDYCDNETPAVMTGPTDGTTAPVQTCININSPAFGQQQYVLRYKYFDWDYYGTNIGEWVNIPGTNNIFDPSAAVFQNIYARSADPFNQGQYGIYIGYFMEDRCVPVGHTGPLPYITTFGTYKYAFIPIKKKPDVSIVPNPSGNLPTTFNCSNSLPFALSGFPAMKSGSPVDGFTASVVGNPSSTVGGISGSNSSSFSFNPGSAPTGNVQINYTWLNTVTNCSNIASTVVTVYQKPTAVAASSITIDGVNDTTPEFCETQNLTLIPFKATPAGGVVYNWYGSSVGTIPLTASANEFYPSSYLTDGDGDRKPDIATTTFNVTRVTNRSAFFNGCESDPLPLTVKIDDAPTVDPGITSLSICSGSTLLLADLAASITPGIGHTPPLSGTWSGAGTFLDVSDNSNPDFDLARRYRPSPAEVTARTATITLTSDPPGGACSAVAKSVSFAINNNVTVTAIPDFTVCAGDPIEVSATLTGGLSNTTWSENGAAAVDDPTKLTAKYVSTPTENLIGSTIIFTIETEDPDGTSGPCISSSDIVNVHISKRATVEAGPDLNLCSNVPVQLAGSIPTSSAATSFAWSTTGLGSFAGNNNTIGNAVYVADQTEKDQQTDIVFTLTSNDPDGPGPNGPCPVETDQMTVRVNPEVKVVVPPAFTVCQSDTDPIRLSATLTGIPVGITWTENGQSGITTGEEHSFASSYMPAASEAGSTITFTVTSDDPIGPCPVASAQVPVQINRRATVNAGPDIVVCSDNSITLAGSKPSGSSALGFKWTGGTGTFGDDLSLTSGYVPSTTELAGAVFDLTLTSDDPDGTGPNGPCPQETDIVTVTVHAKPLPPTTTVAGANPQFKYCVGDAVVNDLTASGTSPKWYSDAALTNLRGAGSTFASGVSTTVDQEVTFYATQTTNAGTSFAGCQSVGLPITIIVNPRPEPKFRVENFCLGDDMLFIDETTVKQPTSGPARTIDAWRWDFNDGFAVLEYGAGNIPAGTRNDMTKGTYKDPINKFPKTGLYNVRLEAKTSDGCVLGINAAQLAQFNGNAIRVGPVPAADFTWHKICDGDETAFAYTGTEVAEVAHWDWDFGNAASGTNTSADAAPKHKFSGVGTYNVTLKVTSVLNCTNTIVKSASILPYINKFPYVETFEGSSHGWVTEGANGTTSWSLVTSTGGSISSDPNPVAGPKFWATHKDLGGDKFYGDNERSVLYGPCVDMTKLVRPVIAMDYMSDTEPKGDGAYMEVLDETAANPEWVRLGDDVSGLQWYNENSIGGLASLSGIGQNVGQFGWSGDSQTFDPNDPQGWKTGRYNLDNLADRSRLRFRIVFGSNTSPLNTSRYDGFAIDYFKLESRNRTVLVENFTSKSSAVSVVNNTSAFKAFPSAAASGEVVKIEYHTGIPVSAGDAADPIFTQNPMDPNARASFYGLSSVPRGYIDGYTTPTGNAMFGTNTAGQISSWASTYYSTESLVTSPLTIKINSPSISNGTLNVTGDVLANEFDLSANQYSLYVAIVEETVESDSYVLRKMLPSASGKKVPATAKGQKFTFNETWAIDRSYLSANPKLVIVAFVQSDINVGGKRQVLQAAYNNEPITLNYTTALEVPFLEQTAIHPNPADHNVNIELPQATATGVEVKVIDQLGRPVLQSAIGIGQRSTTIDTSSLAGAVYIVQLNENGVYTARKLVVAHRH